MKDGSALKCFFEMITAQGGDISVFDNPMAFHNPGATQVVEAWERGYIARDGYDGAGLGGAADRRRARKAWRARGYARRN